MIIFKQAVSADADYTVPNQPSCVIFDVHNDTPFNMGVSFGHDTGVDNADYFTTPHSVLLGIKPIANAPSISNVKWTGTIYIYTETPLGTGSTNLSTAPAFQITMIGYQAGYQPIGTTSLARMTSTPNTVNTAMSGNTLVNTGNAPGANVITTSSTGASGNTALATNDGLWALASTIAGAIVVWLQSFEPGAGGTILQLGAATYLAEILGNLKADGTLTVVGATSLDNGAFLTDGAGNVAMNSVDLSAKIIQDGAGNNLADWSAGGLFLKTNPSVGGPLTYQNPGGTTKFSINAMGGTVSTCGSGTTISHGMGVTPTTLVCNPVVAQPGSGTIGAANYNSTTFRATIGAGTSLIWYGITF